jgi:HD-GYP domain-containing protein (c-di-GMP phosphodiesterase class II)
LEAKILAVADVIEAMATHRPYRAALSIEEALDEIKNNQGKLYDSNVVNACLTIFNNKSFMLD